MPSRTTTQRAPQKAREEKSPSTQAGEFVREEIEHVREGKHGARSTKQAIAIGLSKARRAGVKLPAPKPGKASESTRRSAARDVAKGKEGGDDSPSPKRSRAAKAALKREGTDAASHDALSEHARGAAARRGSGATPKKRAHPKATKRRSARHAA